MVQWLRTNFHYAIRDDIYLSKVKPNFQIKSEFMYFDWLRPLRLERNNKYFLYGTKISINKSFTVYTPKQTVLRWNFTVLQRCLQCLTLPSPYAGFYAHVWTASQSIRSQNYFCISITVRWLLFTYRVNWFGQRNTKPDFLYGPSLRVKPDFHSHLSPIADAIFR